MAAPAWQSPDTASAYREFEDDDSYATVGLVPGERIGPPIARPRGRAWRWLGFVTLVTGGGWAMLGQPTSIPAWLSSALATVMSTLDSKPTRPAEPAAANTGASANDLLAPLTTVRDIPPSPKPADQSEIAAPSHTAQKPGDAPPTTASLAPAVPAAEQPAASRLPPPAIDPADPLQARAAAVGLHPGLSRVLLARLSPADYRNAGIAIQTAIDQTPDTAVLVWPPRRKPELALFTVRFVAGAAADCRRYVVTVTKDGWLTTALPMEKCGSPPGRATRKG